MLPYGAQDGEGSEDSFMKDLANQQTSPPRKGQNFVIKQMTQRSQVMRPAVKNSVKNPVKMLRTAKSRDNIGCPAVDLPMMDDRYGKLRDYRMVWYPRSKGNASAGFMIDSKEGRTCIYHNNICYMYGGHSPSTDQIFFQGYNLATKKMFEVKSKSTREPLPRAFHSCNFVDDMLVIFGGEIFSIYTDSRLMTNELILFSLRHSEYIKVNIHDNIDPRKHHAACIIGAHLVIYGGIDEDCKTLNSFLTLNLGKHTESTGLYSRPQEGSAPRLAWKRAPIEFDLRSLSNHTMTPIFLSSPKGLATGNIKTRVNNLMDPKKVALEGLYIFGGQDENGQFSNTLQIIDTCKLFSS